MSVAATGRMHSGATAPPARNLAERICPVSHGHAVGTESVACVTEISVGRHAVKAGNAESPEQLPSARTKGTDVKSN